MSIVEVGQETSATKSLPTEFPSVVPCSWLSQPLTPVWKCLDKIGRENTAEGWLKTAAKKKPQKTNKTTPKKPTTQKMIHPALPISFMWCSQSHQPLETQGYDVPQADRLLTKWFVDTHPPHRYPRVCEMPHRRRLLLPHFGKQEYIFLYFSSLLGTPGHCSGGHHTAAPECPFPPCNNFGPLPGMVRPRNKGNP